LVRRERARCVALDLKNENDEWPSSLRTTLNQKKSRPVAWAEVIENGFLGNPAD
jgi:hypothetical protein